VLKSGLKARSMFDLSLPSKSLHHQPVLSGRPEVTGVSPREGPTGSETRLTIRGSNLGQSATDVVRLSVAGLDCLSALDYESSTRLSCLVRPTAVSEPTEGDVIVETRSGGLGISMVRFRFVDSGVDDDHDDHFAAVPYDTGESRQTGTASLLRMTSAPAASIVSGLKQHVVNFFAVLNKTAMFSSGGDAIAPVHWNWNVMSQYPSILKEFVRFERNFVCRWRSMSAT